MAKELKPFSEGEYIAVAEWWEMLNDLMDDNGISFAMRFRFLIRTGGLAKNVHEGYRKRVIDFMKKGKDRSKWLLNYDAKTSEENYQYWLFIWVDVAVKFIIEFFMVLKTSVVEEGLAALIEKKEYNFTDKEDPVNKDVYRVKLLMQDILEYMEERGSDLLQSPVYIIGLIQKWLPTQGVGGTIILDYLEKALETLKVDPEQVFPVGHKKTDAELELIKEQGSGNCTTDTHLLVLEFLKRKGTVRGLKYSVTSLTAARRLAKEVSGDQSDDDGFETKASKKETKSRSKERKANQVSTDYEKKGKMVMYTNAKGEESPDACRDCGMFHPSGKHGDCMFYDTSTKTFKIDAFLKFKNVRSVNADGSSSVSPYWLDKLEKWGWRAMGITKDSDQKLIIKDLKKAARDLPTVPEHQRGKVGKTYAAKEGKSEVSNLQEQIVALTDVVRSLKPSKSSSKDKKSSAKGGRARKQTVEKKKAKTRGKNTQGSMTTSLTYSEDEDSDPPPDCVTDSSEDEDSSEEDSGSGSG
jgi:hypothetical protein